MNSESTILVGLSPEAVCIQVHGKGSFKESAALKQFGREMIESGQRTFFVDLKDCATMDSTFMGTLTGLALRLRDANGGVMHVVNHNERNTDLMTGLGLDQILTLDGPREMFPCRPVAAGPAPTKLEMAEHMLHAHEALCAESESNRYRFSDLLEFLRHKVGKPEPIAKR